MADIYMQVLDPKATHKNLPDCPSRVVRDLRGKWVCLDCSLPIEVVCIRLQEVKDEALPQG